jgi:hypothetical protein
MHEFSKGAEPPFELVRQRRVQGADNNRPIEQADAFLEAWQLNSSDQSTCPNVFGPRNRSRFEHERRWFAGETEDHANLCPRASGTLSVALVQRVIPRVQDHGAGS